MKRSRNKADRRCGYDRTPMIHRVHRRWTLGHSCEQIVFQSLLIRVSSCLSERMLGSLIWQGQTSCITYRTHLPRLLRIVPFPNFHNIPWPDGTRYTLDLRTCQLQLYLYSGRRDLQRSLCNFDQRRIPGDSSFSGQGTVGDTLERPSVQWRVHATQIRRPLLSLWLNIR